MDELSDGRANDPRYVYDELRRHITQLNADAPVVAVLFADLVSSTEYKAQRELITALMKVHVHNTEIQQRVREHGGAVVKSLGDGVMATFAEPHGSIRAVRAAVSIQREFASMNAKVIRSEHVESRIGIALGPVVNFASRAPDGAAINDPHGPTVDRAARLCSLAAPSQVICDEPLVSSHRVTDVSQRFSPAALRRLKSFPHPVTVYAADWSHTTNDEIPFLPPTYHESGFLTTEFVLHAVARANRFVRVAGFSNRHYCDNADLLNLIRSKTAADPQFRFELIFMNPQSRFKHYAAQITRRQARDLVPAIRRNAASACRTFGALANVALLYATYPMSIPCVQSDDMLYFSVPFWSDERHDMRMGVVGGPYFDVEAQSDMGQRIIGTVQRDAFVKIDPSTGADGPSASTRGGNTTGRTFE